MKKIFNSFVIGALLLSQSAYASFISFETSGNFIVPLGVTSVNVLVVGGGAGGANGHQGGGAAGYVSSGIFAVTSGQQILVTVGQGGHGGNECISCNTILGLTAGTQSSFGDFLSALGGSVVTGINQSGNNGGSGGGGAWNGSYPGALGGAGGSAGSNGGSATYAGGIGQGDYLSLFNIFNDNNFTAGAGGQGGNYSNGYWNPGGGAGGVLFNGLGPFANDGASIFSGKGGMGYGAGGGAGGFFGFNSTRYAGGDGADGLVYIEYVSPVASDVTTPPMLFLFLGGFLAISFFRNRKPK